MLSLRGVRKAYSGVEVLHGIDFEAHGGEVVAIAGANGAGKSTLIKILCGAVARDAGTIAVDGREVALGSPAAAAALGIRTVHQELTLVPQLSVTENVLLGDLPKRGGLVDWPAAHERTRALLSRTGFTGVDPRTPAKRLSVARQQMVEIAKAMASEPRMLILDEPSAVLAGDDLDQLFALIRSLRADGVLVLYVSHRLDEVMEIADRITVIKDGLIAATSTPRETNEEEIVRQMAGRRLEQIYPDRREKPGRELLGTTGLTREGAFEEVSLSVCAGEVVGVFGLVGSGRTELAECLFAAAPHDAGEIRLAGRAVRLRSPKEAIAQGLAFVTEDRKGSGLVLDLSVRDNAALATLPRWRRHGLLDRKRQQAAIEDMNERLDVRPRTTSKPVKQLSGGNQQKVVLAKWLLSRPKVLILDEPTRGVDVAARVDLYREIDQLTRAGLGVLMISSDLTEVIGATDRVLVMHEGRLVADVPSAEADEELLLAHSIGVAA
ncbi:sugar ABC transporter ATP-binding protein [Conexibacter sp. JD483]|uniref:sugar ABC transporter ATP-binding protein n=1 Tax=unclassified Conexibacter TaxID=2627773 RepID=UPI0027245643|nr:MULTISPECIES: sugar ABC transporter ATP-binding protein [unclassified Conexibacter]MDO8187301.1 sugar ABC transporter ATP-binding protein [Conexibacter sp. CPCC 205706]MDO8198910.1 sugar ABC transporter ATP-binding protein [Conexibacter sp. CPCC 205762]MDR9370649.1 sugar ABC transporter ATP-binding protein [Conexibacter sp. JD483]